MTWDYNGGKVDNDSSRTKSETTQSGTHTFYEDASGFGYPKPEKTGFKFIGWTYSGNGSFTQSNGQINMKGIANGTVTGTLTAQWEQTTAPSLATYTVAWYTTDGETIKDPETRKGEVGKIVSVTLRL